MNLLRPSILPGELGAGYEGRLGRRNGFRDRHETRAALRRSLPGSEERSDFEVLGRAAGLSGQDFQDRHTLRPLWFVPNLIGGINMCPHGAARPNPRFCERCAIEDSDFHGESYWHREHQIPGMHRCQLHGISLRQARRRDACFESPLSQMTDSEPFSEDWNEVQQRYPATGRFFALAAELLAVARPLDRARLSAEFRRRLHQSRIWSRDVTEGQLLSDLFFEGFDPVWLEAIAPRIGEKLREIYFQPIDSAALTGNWASTPIYVAAVALLCCEVDDGIAMLLQPGIRIHPKLSTAVEGSA